MVSRDILRKKIVIFSIKCFSKQIIYIFAARLTGYAGQQVSAYVLINETTNAQLA